MHCQNCGAELVAGSAFCPSCGRPAVSSAPAPTAQATASGLQPNLAGALCYLMGLITGIFFLVADPYKQDRFVRFHAFQSIFLSVAWFAVYFALSIFLSILPGMLWRIGWMLHSAVGLGFFLLWVFVMYKAYNNEQFKLPVLGNLAAKQA
jgi:uncharacterized membrane protein